MRYLITILLFLCLSGFSKAANLTDVSLKAGARGLALILETDQPCVRSYQNILKKDNSVIKIELNDAVCSLAKYSFPEFAAGSPVSSVFIEENDESLIIRVALRNKIYNEIKKKRKENQTLFLISPSAFSEFTWKASDFKPTKAKSTILKKPALNKPILKKSAESLPVERKTYGIIKTIKMNQRGKLDELIIDVTGNIRIGAKEKNGKIIVVFENAKNGLAKNYFELPYNSVFKNLEFRESTLKGKNMVGLIIQKTASIEMSFLRITPGRIIIYAISSRESYPYSMSSWSAENEESFSYTFQDIPKEKQKENETIEVDGPSKQEPEEDVQVRLIIIKQKVNFRSEPNTSSSQNIIRSLEMGEKGTCLGKKRNWYHIRLDEEDVTGWIYATLVADSVEVSKQLWEKIYAFRKKKEDIEKPEPKPEPTPEPEKKEISKETKEEKVSIPSDIPLPELPDTTEKDTLREYTNNTDELINYRIFGRDPFLPLDECDFLSSDLPNVEVCKLVGILYDKKDRIALLEDATKDGEAFAIRENASVSNGRVLKIKKDCVVFLLSEAGLSHRFIMRLKSEKK